MPVALINPFVVPADKEEEFLRAWNQTTRVFSSTPGFIETHLHKNTGVGDGTFQYINRSALSKCRRLECDPRRLQTG